MNTIHRPYASRFNGLPLSPFQAMPFHELFQFLGKRPQSVMLLLTSDVCAYTSYIRFGHREHAVTPAPSEFSLHEISGN